MKLLLLSIFISFSYACEDAWKANTGSGCQVCDSGYVPNAEQTACDAVPLNAVVQYGYALVDDVNSCEDHPGHATLDAAGCTEYGNTLNPTQQPITGHRWIDPQGCSFRGSNLYFTVTGLICGANNFPCVCRSPPVSYTECPPGKIAANNECVQCDAWKIATSTGCQVCDSGYVPNAEQTACSAVPPNAIVNYGYALVDSGSCESHEYTTLDADGCTAYGNTLTYPSGATLNTWEAGTKSPFSPYDYYSSNGCTIRLENGLPKEYDWKPNKMLFFYTASGSSKNCGDTNYWCVCRAPPVSYTECAPGQVAVDNACVQCDAWKIATSAGCQACPDGQVPNPQQTGCDAVPPNAIVNYGFALVDSGSCESHGYTTLDADGCTEYGNTLTYPSGATLNTWEPAVRDTWYSRYYSPNGCALQMRNGAPRESTYNSNGLFFFYLQSGGTLECGVYSCVCRAPPVSYTLCEPGQKVKNNACVQCDAWEIATSAGCQACPDGQVPNARQTGCDAVPPNAIVNYGFALVDSGSCESHGYTTLNTDGCREYGNTLTHPPDAQYTSYKYYSSSTWTPQGCSIMVNSQGEFTISSSDNSYYFKYIISSDVSCGNLGIACVCRAPPVSYTECAPEQYAVNNECVTCSTTGYTRIS